MVLLLRSVLTVECSERMLPAEGINGQQREEHQARQQLSDLRIQVRAV